jgi:hypothetical protein
MGSQRGQASVEWVALLLLVALGLGGLMALAPRVEGRSLGGLLAQRIACAAARDCGAHGDAGSPRGPVSRGGLDRREAAAIAPVAPVVTRSRGRIRDVIRVGAKKAIAWNGLLCYLRESTARGDTNRPSDDIGDAVNCLNPLSGWTGDVGGTDG